jgi:CRISPR-associated protein Csd1
MILTALTQYYQRLLANPDKDSGLPRVPSYGFSEEKVGYILVLSQDGRLVDVQNNMDTSGKKPMPKLTGVPRPEKRTSGVKSNFLWDKTAYVLGVESNKDKESAKETPWIVAQKTFDAFKQFHLERLAETDDAGLQSLRLFLQSWQPAQFNQAPFSPEMIDANVVFKLDGDYQLLHDRVAAKLLWSKMLTPEEGALESNCLVTGEMAPIARLHPAIKGVYGGQSSGGSIVSFNADAYTSYGKSQGENAPVSEAAAFAYTTSLNYLLRRENGQCVSIGDASTVFWAVASDEKAAHEAESLFGWMMNMSADDGQEAAQIKPVLEKIAQGRPLNEFAPNIAASTRFYVLGLAPNASRLSIRYWMDTTFGELSEHVSKHFHDLALEPKTWRDPPSIWRLLIQTAAQGKSENIPPQLAGELMRSIITGQPYPRMLLTQLTQRIRADGDTNGIRISLIKAIIQRDYRKGLIQEEVPMSLDLNSKNAAYLLGRLFATIERIQEAALGRDVNSTVADKYYGSAASVPFSVFPRLLAGSQNHLTKIRRDKPGFAVNLKKDLGEIIAGLDSQFPKHMSIEEQGRFAIGYYHQKQSYFESKSKTDEGVTENNAELLAE